MKQIGDDWKTIPRGSKVTVKEDFPYKGLGGNETVLPQGEYYITGFWANLAGLAKTRQGVRDQVSDYFVNAATLGLFYRRGNA